MPNFNDIYNGWKNLLIPSEELKQTIQGVREERLNICKNCPFNSTQGEITNISHCKACGCHLKAKTSCLSCNCGIEKFNKKNPEANLDIRWFAITVPEQEFEINEKLNTNGKEEQI